MRWILRVVATLVLAPPLYRLVLIYLASQQGEDAGALFRGSVAALAQYYVAFSVPALALIIIILTPAERFLRRSGLLLLTVLFSPLLAWPAALILAHFIQDAGAKGSVGLVAIAVTYGLVWGLTIRETRRSTERVEAADQEPAPAPAVDADAAVAATVASNLAVAKPEPQPMEPQPMVPHPTEPQPTEPQPTEPEFIEAELLDEPPAALPTAKPKAQLTKPLLILPPPRHAAEASAKTSEPDATTPGAADAAVGDIVKRNQREAGQADASGSAARKVADVVAANAAAAAATAPREAVADTADKVSGIVKRNAARAAAGAPKAGPEAGRRHSDRRDDRTAADKVGDVVAGNAARAAASAKLAADAADEDTNAPTSADKAADYWKRTGGVAKPQAREQGDVVDKVAAYRKRMEGREPAPQREAPKSPDTGVVDKVEEIVAANFAQAAEQAPVQPAKAPPAVPQPATATPQAAGDPSEKRMPRASPKLELNERNPLLDRLDAERRKPR